MDRYAKLQFIGPTALFSTVLAGEAAALALSMFPSRPDLWYINLAWFGVLQRSHYVISSWIDIPYFQLLFVALPIFVLACCGFFLRRRLLLAIASNLSLVVAGFLFFSWWTYEPLAQQASLTFVAIPEQPDFYLCIALFAFSLISFVVSHLNFLCDLRTTR
jgi:hypothetical protein